MRIGPIIRDLLIVGGMQVAAELAREKAGATGEQAGSQQSLDAVPGSANADLVSATASYRKALHVIGIVDGLLEQTRDEWMPAFSAAADNPVPASDATQQLINISINQLAVLLRSKGFPSDTDAFFWDTVCELHLELMLHKAYPGAWQGWNEERDSLLERAGAEVKRIVVEQRTETLNRLMPDGQHPRDDAIFTQRLIGAVNELTSKTILPELVQSGFTVENDPLFTARLGSLIFKIFFTDIVEFSRELANSARERKIT